MNVIETNRLIVRSWSASDQPALAQIYGDGETMRYIGKGYPNGLSPEQSGAAIATMTQRYDRDGIGIWAVVLAAGGQLAGACGLQPLPGSGDVEIAFLFGKAYWGNGYAREAATAVMEFGFHERRLTRIVAVVHAANVRSIALINRLEMRFDRVVRVYQSDLLKYVKEAPAG